MLTPKFTSLTQVDTHVRKILQSTAHYPLKHKIRTYNLGIAKLYIEVDGYSRAEMYILEYLSIHPDDVEANLLLAGVLKKQEKFRAAIQYYEKALAVKQDRLDIWLNVARTWIDLSKSYDDSSDTRIVDACINALDTLQKFRSGSRVFYTPSALKIIGEALSQLHMASSKSRYQTMEVSQQINHLVQCPETYAVGNIYVQSLRCLAHTKDFDSYWKIIMTQSLLSNLKFDVEFTETIVKHYHLISPAIQPSIKHVHMCFPFPETRELPVDFLTYIDPFKLYFYDLYLSNAISPSSPLSPARKETLLDHFQNLVTSMVIKHDKAKIEVITFWSRIRQEYLSRLRLYQGIYLLCTVAFQDPKTALEIEATKENLTDCIEKLKRGLSYTHNQQYSSDMSYRIHRTYSHIISILSVYPSLSVFPEFSVDSNNTNTPLLKDVIPLPSYGNATEKLLHPLNLTLSTEKVDTLILQDEYYKIRLSIALDLLQFWVTSDQIKSMIRTISPKVAAEPEYKYSFHQSLPHRPSLSISDIETFLIILIIHRHVHTLRHVTMLRRSHLLPADLLAGNDENSSEDFVQVMDEKSHVDLNDIGAALPMLISQSGEWKPSIQQERFWRTIAVMYSHSQGSNGLSMIYYNLRSSKNSDANSEDTSEYTIMGDTEFNSCLRDLRGIQIDSETELEKSWNKYLFFCVSKVFTTLTERYGRDRSKEAEYYKNISNSIDLSSSNETRLSSGSEHSSILVPDDVELHSLNEVLTRYLNSLENGFEFVKANAGSTVPDNDFDGNNETSSLSPLRQNNRESNRRFPYPIPSFNNRFRSAPSSNSVSSQRITNDDKPPAESLDEVFADMTNSTYNRVSPSKILNRSYPSNRLSTTATPSPRKFPGVRYLRSQIRKGKSGNRSESHQIQSTVENGNIEMTTSKEDSVGDETNIFNQSMSSSTSSNSRLDRQKGLLNKLRQRNNEASSSQSSEDTDVSGLMEPIKVDGDGVTTEQEKEKGLLMGKNNGTLSKRLIRQLERLHNVRNNGKPAEQITQSPATQVTNGTQNATQPEPKVQPRPRSRSPPKIKPSLPTLTTKPPAPPVPTSTIPVVSNAIPTTIPPAPPLTIPKSDHSATQMQSNNETKPSSVVSPPPAFGFASPLSTNVSSTPSFSFSKTTPASFSITPSTLPQASASSSTSWSTAFSIPKTEAPKSEPKETKTVPAKEESKKSNVQPAIKDVQTPQEKVEAVSSVGFKGFGFGGCGQNSNSESVQAKKDNVAFGFGTLKTETTEQEPLTGSKVAADTPSLRIGSAPSVNFGFASSGQKVGDGSAKSTSNQLEPSAASSASATASANTQHVTSDTENDTEKKAEVTKKKVDSFGSAANAGTGFGFGFGASKADDGASETKKDTARSNNFGFGIGSAQVGPNNSQSSGISGFGAFSAKPANSTQPVAFGFGSGLGNKEKVSSTDTVEAETEKTTVESTQSDQSSSNQQQAVAFGTTTFGATATPQPPLSGFASFGSQNTSFSSFANSPSGFSAFAGKPSIFGTSSQPALPPQNNTTTFASTSFAPRSAPIPSFNNTPLRKPTMYDSDASSESEVESDDDALMKKFENKKPIPTLVPPFNGGNGNARGNESQAILSGLSISYEDEADSSSDISDVSEGDINDAATVEATPDQGPEDKLVTSSISDLPTSTPHLQQQPSQGNFEEKTQAVSDDQDNQDFEFVDAYQEPVKEELDEDIETEVVAGEEVQERDNEEEVPGVSVCEEPSFCNDSISTIRDAEDQSSEFTLQDVQDVSQDLVEVSERDETDFDDDHRLMEDEAVEGGNDTAVLIQPNSEEESVETAEINEGPRTEEIKTNDKVPDVTSMSENPPTEIDQIGENAESEVETYYDDMVEEPAEIVKPSEKMPTVNVEAGIATEIDENEETLAAEHDTENYRTDVFDEVDTDKLEDQTQAASTFTSEHELQEEEVDDVVVINDMDQSEFAEEFTSGVSSEEIDGESSKHETEEDDAFEESVDSPTANDAVSKSTKVVGEDVALTSEYDQESQKEVSKAEEIDLTSVKSDNEQEMDEETDIETKSGGQAGEIQEDDIEIREAKVAAAGINAEAELEATSENEDETQEQGEGESVSDAVSAEGAEFGISDAQSEMEYGTNEKKEIIEEFQNEVDNDYVDVQSADVRSEMEGQIFAVETPVTPTASSRLNLGEETSVDENDFVNNDEVTNDENADQDSDVVGKTESSTAASEKRKKRVSFALPPEEDDSKDDLFDIENDNAEEEEEDIEKEKNEEYDMTEDENQEAESQKILENLEFDGSVVADNNNHPEIEHAVDIEEKLSGEEEDALQHQDTGRPIELNSEYQNEGIYEGHENEESPGTLEGIERERAINDNQDEVENSTQVDNRTSSDFTDDQDVSSHPQPGEVLNDDSFESQHEVLGEAGNADNDDSNATPEETENERLSIDEQYQAENTTSVEENSTGTEYENQTLSIDDGVEEEDVPANASQKMSDESDIADVSIHTDEMDEGPEQEGGEGETEANTSVQSVDSAGSSQTTSPSKKKKKKKRKGKGKK